MRTGLSGLGHDACTAPETPTVQLSSTPASVYVPSGKSGVPASSTTLQLAGTMPVSSAAYCAISELQEEKNVVHSAWHGRWGSEPVRREYEDEPTTVSSRTSIVAGGKVAETGKFERWVKLEADKETRRTVRLARITHG